ncbi:hypothetical protein ZWY2020_006003 [Hordeum vulgare]|nr:hypothetical protein ZWY2020_006003 [Hordeum vulgare]
MSADESLRPHQLNSFATFLEENLRVSSESSRAQFPEQKPQLKKMEDDRKQKGGKKLEQNTAIDILEDIYLDFCTPYEQESMPKRKIRLQKIERGWVKEWKKYRFVTPKYAKKFALKPPGKRPPIEDHQNAHPSSLKTIDDYPEEKTKHLSKLQKQEEVVVRKFNEEYAAAAAATSSAAETSGMAIPQVKRVPQKSKAPKPQEKLLQKAASASAPKPSTTTHASKPEHKQIVKQVPTVTSSETKSSPTPLKTKMTAGRGNKPSPSKVIKVPTTSEGSDEYDDETLQANIRNKQERVAQASGSAIPLAMDPKVLLDYFNVWYDDPNTPIDDLKLPPGINHMVATFINEAKWKETQAKQAKVAKLKKEKFLKQNLLSLTPDALVSTHAELKTLKDKYTKLSDHQSLKTNFIKFATNAVDDYNKKAPPPAKPQQPTVEEEQATPAEEMPQEAKDIPADASKPADESAPAEENAPAEETARTDTAPPPEEKMPSPILEVEENDSVCIRREENQGCRKRS